MSRSITRRLIGAVLIAEALAAVALIAAVTTHEHRVQYEAFDANLRGTANILFGAVQDAEDSADNVLLDRRGLTLPSEAIYRVQDDLGRTLGSAGTLPPGPLQAGGFKSLQAAGHSYRFYSLAGDRIIDPGKDGGIHHPVTVVYGLPDGRVWHEVFDTVRFFSLATLLLLSITTVLLIWIIRRLTRPIHQLAYAAESITVRGWNFAPPREAREVKELQPLVSALERALSRLHASFEQQKRFTSDAAHELKTNLAIVKSSLQLVTMKQRTRDEYERGVTVALGDLARMEDALQQMLTLARVEQPSGTAGQTCRLDEALHAAVQLAMPAAEVKGVSFAQQASTPSLVACEFRDAMLLCSNIVMNAIQYTADGTVVAIALRSSGTHCLLQVKDAGRGVEEAEVSRLFEPFYRGDPSRSRVSGGTGLGLSICKAVCDRAGGTIAISNRPEGGAVVTVELPLAPAPA